MPPNGSKLAKLVRQHGNFDPADASTEGWTRSPDDPHVVGLREYLRRENGIKDLEVCDPSEIDKAASLFHRDGFVAVRDVLTPKQLARMKAATGEPRF